MSRIEINALCERFHVLYCRNQEVSHSPNSFLNAANFVSHETLWKVQINVCNI